MIQVLQKRRVSKIGIPSMTIPEKPCATAPRWGLDSVDDGVSNRQYQRLPDAVGDGPLDPRRVWNLLVQSSKMIQNSCGLSSFPMENFENLPYLGWNSCVSNFEYCPPWNWPSIWHVDGHFLHENKHHLGIHGVSTQCFHEPQMEPTWCGWGSA